MNNLRTLYERLFSVVAYATGTQRDRARMTYNFALFSLLAFLVYASFAPGQYQGQVMLAGVLAGDFTSVISTVGVVVFTLLAFFFTYRGHLSTAGLCVIALFFFATFFLSYRVAFSRPESGAFLIGQILVCGLFLYGRGIVLGLVISIASLTFAQLFPTREPNSLASYLILILTFLGTGVLVLLFLRLAKIGSMELQEQMNDERLRLATITTKIAGLISRRQPLSSVLNTTIEEILDGYPTIYHAQIFLIEEGGTRARLVASTGEVGQMLLNRQHGLDVGSQSVIGRVTASGQTVIARAGAADGIHKFNPLLPDTLVEAALPLRVGERVIGALDVQSRQIESFLQPEIPVFEALADTVAVALDNARLYEETERQLIENRNLVDQMQGAMGEVERLNRQLTGMAWMDFLQPNRDRVNLDFSVQTGLQANAVWTPTLQEAAQGGSLVQHENNGQQVISLPVRVRGVVVGAVEFTIPRSDLSPDDLAVAQTVIERFGIAAESLRLYEESQRATVQEQRVNEIATRYQQVTSVDDLLSITVAELSQTLGAKTGSIRLGRLPAGASTNGHPQGGGQPA